MEKVLKLGGGENPKLQEISLEIKSGSSERLTYESYKTKYINGKQSGVTNVGISGVSDNTDYLLEIDDLIQITARADNTSGTCTITQNESGNQYLIHCTTPQNRIDNEILVTISKDPYDGLIANIDVSSMYEVASDIDFTALIQYGVSPSDVRDIEITLNKGDSFTSINTPIQKEANPKFLEHDYWPKEDDKYNYIVSFM